MAVRIIRDRIPNDILLKSIKKCRVTLPSPMRRSHFKPVIQCFKNDKKDPYIYLPKRFDYELKQYCEEEPQYHIIDINKIHIKKSLYSDESQNHLPEGIRRYQQTTHDEIIYMLSAYGSTMLHASTSYGKTLISIYVIKTVALRTLICCPSLEVREQWRRELEASSFRVSFGGDPTISCDVYITSPEMLGKCTSHSLQLYGLVIVDEVQSFAKKSVTHSLLKTIPRFLLGCSATPDTKDGVDASFPLYYGPVNTWIKKLLVKDFVVYQIETIFKCDALTNENGMIPHSEVMKSYYSQKDFHRLICRVINKIGERRCMVMFAREEYGSRLFRDYLDSKSYTNYAYYVANSKSYDRTKRILITTYHKCGYGIDDPGLSVLIMVHDGSDVRQPSGRIRKDENFYIVDFVHPRKQQKLHATSREKILITGGGEIVKLKYNELDKMMFN